MLGLFMVMGALHAATPGHGKALAAAYLAASDGKPRDAFALAGIVTLTHTASVYLLAGATLLASQFFAPSRVIPAMQIVSGGLVALLGMMMLRGAIQKRRAKTVVAETQTHTHEHHHHDEEMTDEEHARYHAEEALQIQREGGRSFRRLAVLGVSGGMVPCPDALAILLLAIGMNQLPTGLVAIAAFSLGLGRRSGGVRGGGRAGQTSRQRSSAATGSTDQWFVPARFGRFTRASLCAGSECALCHGSRCRHADPGAGGFLNVRARAGIIQC